MLIIIITLRTFFSNVDLQKLSSHRLHLLFDSRSSIERAHNSTHITSCTNGRQTGNTTTDHEHFTRWHFSGRRDLTGEKSSEMIGCLENGFVAGDIRHRTQCIKHLYVNKYVSIVYNWFILTDEEFINYLSTTYSRNTVHSKNGRLLLGKCLNYRFILCWIQETNQCLVVFKLVYFLLNINKNLL